jgi:DNA-binding response OmpR family regulator
VRAPRVLIVDGDDDLAHRVADAIRALGVVVLTARPHDALAVLRLFRVDLLVIDVDLGDVTSLAFLDGRNADPEQAGVAAMFVSAHSALEIARRGHGSRYFVSKASAIEILVSSIVNAALLAMP